MIRIRQVPMNSKFQYCGELLTMKDCTFVGHSQYIDDYGSLVTESTYEITVLDDANNERKLSVDGNATVAVHELYKFSSTQQSKHEL